MASSQYIAPFRSLVIRFLVREFLTVRSDISYGK